MIPGVARYVTLNASHHKEQQYIGLGGWDLNSFRDIIYLILFHFLWPHPVAHPNPESVA